MKFWKSSYELLEKPIDLNHDVFQRPANVVVLGAGASKDAGFPIISDFKSDDYFSLILDSLTKKSIETFEWVKEQPENFEVLLANCLKRGDNELYEDLLAFYEEVFLKAETKSAKFHQWDYLFKFVIYSAVMGKERHVVFITFNHDLILEYTNTKNLKYNYGSLTNKLFCHKGQNPELNDPGYDFTILKLHGSFNMLSCTNCNRIMSWDDYAWQWQGSTCSACKKGILKPLYIAPTPFKDYHPLMESWKDAESALQRAKNILVLGYSLPDYDHHAIELLKNTNPYASLFVVDKYATHIAPKYSKFTRGTKAFKSISAKEFGERLFDSGKFTDVIHF